MSHFQICISPTQMSFRSSFQSPERGKRATLMSELRLCCSMQRGFELILYFSRGPPEAEEGSGVLGAAVRSAGDSLVVQVQHLGGARPLCGAAPLELRHPPQ